MAGIFVTLILPALLDAGVGIAQGAFNNSQAQKSADQQYKKQIEFWKMQNDYNSPTAQRDRLQSAGFNPSSVVGDVAQGNTAGDLSSVPGNEYAQEGFLRLEGLARTLETMARIENLGSETNLNVSQLTTESYRQILLGLGYDEKKVDIALKELELKSNELDYEYKPKFLAHQLNMAEFDELLAQSKIAHENSLKSLADAQTEESKALAQKTAAETGLVLLKQETEKSIANLNYALATKARSESDKVKWETQKSMVLAPFERQAMKLANELQASENQKVEIEAALKQLDVDAKSNPEGKPNAWYYIDRTLETIGNILGVAAGAYLGSKTGTKAKASGAGSGLYVPGSTKIGGENFVRL